MSANAASPGTRRKPRRWLLFRPLDLFARLWPVWRRKWGVLVVRIDGIGDVVLFHGAFAHYTAALGLEAREITVLGCKSWARLAPVFFPGARFYAIDEHAYDRNPFYRLKVSLWVRRQNFSTVLLDSFMRKPLVADSLVYVSAAPHCIVARPYVSPKTQRLFDWYLTRCERVIDTGLHPTHESLRHFAFVSALSGRLVAPEGPRLPRRHGKPPLPRPYAVMNFGANEAGRRWAFSNYLALAEDLAARGFAVAFVGGPAEATYKNRLDGQRFVDLISATSLEGLMDLLQHAALVISNETGPAHLAVALGAPTIVILGGGQFGGWMPFPDEIAPKNARFVYRKMPCFSCLWNCTQPHIKGDAYPCVAAATEDEVRRAVDELLADESVRCRT